MWPEKFSLKRNRQEGFLSHLDELRRRLIICLAVFFIAASANYFFSSQWIEFLILPLKSYSQAQLFFQKPYEAFYTHLKVAGLAGFLFASPVIFTQIWFFIAPALYDKEKKIVFPLIGVSLALFLGGVIFAYQCVIPWGLYFLLSFRSESLSPLLTVTPYFSFLFGMLLSFGFLFVFPMFLIGAVYFKMVTTKALAKARKIAIIAVFILAAIITPSPDPISQMMLALPLLVLFEISLWIAGRIEKAGK